MISTLFAIGTAIIFRIFLLWILGVDRLNTAVAGNWIILTIPLLTLIYLDLRRGIKRSPYWIVTLLLAIAHIGYWTYAKSEGWMAFCQWFMNL